MSEKEKNQKDVVEFHLDLVASREVIQLLFQTLAATVNEFGKVVQESLEKTETK